MKEAFENKYELSMTWTLFFFFSPNKQMRDTLEKKEILKLKKIFFYVSPELKVGAQSCRCRCHRKKKFRVKSTEIK
jgi:hypothetical protein